MQTEHPPIPEELKGKEKTKLDVVFAAGPEGKIYAIPTEVAEQHVFEGDHPPIINPLDLHSNEGQEEEVQGHHAVYLPRMGIMGYHSDWLYGPYLWWYDGCWYNGLHYHAWGAYDQRARDQDG